MVTLSGSLGAGKSVFARAIMRALGVKDKALPSPSYTIIQEYNGCIAHQEIKVAHMDWYRLQDADEIEMLGVREYFAPPWISMIEWAEVAPSLIPEHAIQVSIYLDEQHVEKRLIKVSSLSWGSAYPLIQS